MEYYYHIIYFADEYVLGEVYHSNLDDGINKLTNIVKVAGLRYCIREKVQKDFLNHGYVCLKDYSNEYNETINGYLYINDIYVKRIERTLISNDDYFVSKSEYITFEDLEKIESFKESALYQENMHQLYNFKSRVLSFPKPIFVFSEILIIMFLAYMIKGLLASLIILFIWILFKTLFPTCLFTLLNKPYEMTYYKELEKINTNYNIANTYFAQKVKEYKKINILNYKYYPICLLDKSLINYSFKNICPEDFAALFRKYKIEMKNIIYTNEGLAFRYYDRKKESYILLVCDYSLKENGLNNSLFMTPSDIFKEIELCQVH